MFELRVRRVFLFDHSFGKYPRHVDFLYTCFPIGHVVCRSGKATKVPASLAYVGGCEHLQMLML